MNTELSIISLTEKSIKSAYLLADIFDKCDIYIMEKHKKLLNEKSIEKDKIIFYENLNTLVENIFYKYKTIIFIMATGIVVRTIARFIKDKATDPAIIVCDEKLNFAISILSGHIGGANEICRYIQQHTKAIAVITTATDINEKTALDNIALKLSAFRNEDRPLYKKINYMLANSDEVYLLSDINLDKTLDLRGFKVITKEDIKNIKNKTIVYITYKNNIVIDDTNHYIKIVPRCVCLGIGCKKNTSYDLLKEVLEEYLQENNIDIKSIFKIASIDIKKDEKAILELSNKLDVDFVTMTAKEILSNKYYINIEKNDFVRKITGVDSVSLGCAKILSNDNIIAYNLRKKGITISAGLKQ